MTSLSKAFGKSNSSSGSFRRKGVNKSDALEGGGWLKYSRVSAVKASVFSIVAAMLPEKGDTEAATSSGWVDISNHPTGGPPSVSITSSKTLCFVTVTLTPVDGRRALTELTVSARGGPEDERIRRSLTPPPPVFYVTGPAPERVRLHRRSCLSRP